jgi:hypothetical protein
MHGIKDTISLECDYWATASGATCSPDSAAAPTRCHGRQGIWTRHGGRCKGFRARLLTGLYRFQFFSRADEQLLALPISDNHVLGRKCDYLPFLFVVPHILELQHPHGRTDAKVVEPIYFAKCSGQRGRKAKVNHAYRHVGLQGFSKIAMLGARPDSGRDRAFIAG